MPVINLFAAILLGALTAVGGSLDGVWIEGRTNKDPLSYGEGEEMVFTLTPRGLDGELPTNAYCLVWTRTGDDGIKRSGRVPFAKEAFVYRTSLGKPGFVRLYAEVLDTNGKRVIKNVKYKGDVTTPEGKEAMNRFERLPKHIFFDGGAGVRPETLEGVPEPVDFDAFWVGQKKKLAEVPFKDAVEVVEVGRDKKGVIYQVKIPCAGPRPVTGHLTIPLAADKGEKFPAHLTLDGYNGELKRFERKPSSASALEIVLHINAHGYELGKDAAFYAAFGKSIMAGGKTYALSAVEHQTPVGCYFEGMVLRVLRALDYLKARPEWNGRDLIVSGGSQGGLQTAWAAALDGDVTLAKASVPWCCDMGGAIRFGRNNRQWGVEYTPAMDYYDPVNMAKRVPKTCRMEIPRAGLGDYTCPPSGIAVFYNNLTCPKKITWVQGSQHGYVPPEAYEGRDFVRETH